MNNDGRYDTANRSRAALANRNRNRKANEEFKDALLANLNQPDLDVEDLRRVLVKIVDQLPCP